MDSAEVFNVSSSPLQICPRTGSQKSPLKFVCSPPSSRSTSTTTASSASQKPSSTCRCWLIWTSGEQRSQSVHVLRKFLFPFQNRARQRRFLFYWNWSAVHSSSCVLVQTFDFSPQPKPAVRSAKILVQPPPQSSAREQQQAGVHPRGDRQSQRADGAGEQQFVSVNTSSACRTDRVVSFSVLCLPSQDVSCNEIQVLPAQVGRLQALRELNVRKNCLHMLPEGQSSFWAAMQTPEQISNQIKWSDDSLYAIITLYVQITWHWSSNVDWWALRFVWNDKSVWFEDVRPAADISLKSSGWLNIFGTPGSSLGRCCYVTIISWVRRQSTTTKNSSETNKPSSFSEVHWAVTLQHLSLLTESVNVTDVIRLYDGI